MFANQLMLQYQILIVNHIAYTMTLKIQAFALEFNLSWHLFVDAIMLWILLIVVHHQLVFQILIVKLIVTLMEPRVQWTHICQVFAPVLYNDKFTYFIFCLLKNNIIFENISFDKLYFLFHLFFFFTILNEFILFYKLLSLKKKKKILV